MFTNQPLLYLFHSLEGADLRVDRRDPVGQVAARGWHRNLQHTRGRACVGGRVCVWGGGLAAPYYLNVSHLTGIVFVAHHAILVTRISDHGRFSSFPRFRVVGTLLECGGANTN